MIFLKLTVIIHLLGVDFNDDAESPLAGKSRGTRFGEPVKHADVLGSNAVVQRCQLQKRRNVKDHLPKSRQAQVDAVKRQAHGSGSSVAARKQLRSLAAALEREGPDGAPPPTAWRERIKGYRDLRVLADALRDHAP